MTIAVFSDIHGNIYSLEKALKIMEQYKPDKYLFLGDMAGYYYYQNESIDLLNNLDDLISIKGNHDEYFLKSLNDKEYLKKLINKYGKSYQYLHDNITKQSLSFFNNLKENEKNEQFEAYHGSPNNHLEGYCYPDSEINFESNAPILFLGHTHYPMQRTNEEITIINPGSIGQPRDFNKGSFSIVDINNIKVENIRYEYKKEKLTKTVIKLNDNKYLKDVLEREKNERN